MPFSECVFVEFMQRDLRYYRSNGVSFETKGGTLLLRAGDTQWEWSNNVALRKSSGDPLDFMVTAEQFQKVITEGGVSCGEGEKSGEAGTDPR